jgi:hypothetical protein
MKKVNKFIRLVRRFRNSDHYEFYKEIIRFAMRYKEDMGELRKLLLAFEAAFQKEDKIFKRSIRSYETPEVGETNQKRLIVFRRIKLYVDAAHYDKNPAKQAAATALDFVLNNFKSIPTVTSTQASALIINMIQDLRLPKFATHVATLDLTDAVDDLEAANEAFETIYFEREQSQGNALLEGNMKYARPLTDKAGKNFAEGLNSFYLIAKLGNNAADMEILGAIIDGINNTIHNYDRKYAHTGGASGGSKPKPAEPGIPTFAIAAQAVTDGSTMYVTLSDPDSAADFFAEAVGATLILLFNPEAGVAAFDLFPITGLELSQESGETGKPIGLKVGPQANSVFTVPTHNGGPCPARVEKDDVILAHLTGAFYPGSVTADVFK